MEKKKSQIFGQVVVYIIAIIIFSAILIYGYKAVRGFSERAEEVSLIQFTEDIKASIKKIASDYGSVVKKELHVPGKYSYVCFVDLSKNANIDLESEHPVVYNSWEDKSQQNMFLITSKEEVQPYYIGEISIRDDYKCLRVTDGKIALRLEGKGDYVELSEWS